MKDKIRILYIMPRCTKSGPIQVLENIIKYMDQNKYELYLITINEENKNRSVLDSFSVGMKYQYIPIKKVDAILGKVGPLKKAIKEIQPDAIHTTGFIPDYIISKIIPEKQLTILHANLRMDYYYLCGKYKGAVLSRIHEHVLKKIGTVVACSKSLSDIYKKRGYNIPFVRNGVESHTTNMNYSVTRKDLGIKEDGIVFLYAASFNERKNHKFLLECFSKLECNIILLLLGDGPTYEGLKSNYSSHRNIIFKGRVNNVSDYMKISDYFVSSSIQEGLPMGVIEAMAEGLPVLLSDIEQHREVWEVNPLVGELYKLNDSNDFLAKMNVLLKRDRYQASIASTETVSKYFNSQKMSEAYQDYYKDIALR